MNKDILNTNGQSSDWESAFDNAEASDSRSVLPAGEYVMFAKQGSIQHSAKKGTPSYQIIFEVIEGEQVGRKLWHDLWLTPAAMPQTKFDLSKFGIKSRAEMDKPLPRYFKCQVKVVVRKEDDGTERNRIRSFEVLELITPEADPFAPTDLEEGGNELVF